MSVNRIGEASDQIGKTSSALREIIGFLENNKVFLEKFGDLVRNQDRDVQLLIGYLEGYLTFTQSIDFIADENTREVSRSNEMIEKIEKFYHNLSDISNTLLQLSESLSDDIGTMKSTLQLTDQETMQ